MKNRTMLGASLFTLMLLLASATSAQAQGANKIAALTWNVHGTNIGGTCGSERDLSAVKYQLQLIKWNYARFGIAIDVFALQEIYRDQAYELARALSIPAGRVDFVQTRDAVHCNGKDFGTGILSSLPVVGEPLANTRMTCPQSPGPATEYRTCVQLKETWTDFNTKSHGHNILSAISVRLPTGKKVRVYNAHLVGDNSVWDQSRPANTPANERIAWIQVQQVADLINRNSSVTSYPSILMGDFNVHPAHSPYSPPYTQYNYLALIWYGFRDLWEEWLPRRSSLTNPYGNTVTGKRVDYIVTRDSRIHITTADVAETGGASDHRPMIAYLNY